MYLLIIQEELRVNKIIIKALFVSFQGEADEFCILHKATHGQSFQETLCRNCEMSRCLHLYALINRFMCWAKIPNNTGGQCVRCAKLDVIIWTAEAHITLNDSIQLNVLDKWIYRYKLVCCFWIKGLVYLLTNVTPLFRVNHEKGGIFCNSPFKLTRLAWIMKLFWGILSFL